MIQNVLRNLGGIEGYGILSLCLFFAVFTGAVIWACLQKRAHLEQMARLPLEPEPDQPHNHPQS